MIPTVFDAREALAKMAELDDQIVASAKERVVLQQRIEQARDRCDETKALVLATVEGKNETERKARAVEALRAHAGYGESYAHVCQLESEVTLIDVHLESLKRQYRRLALLIEWQTAALAHGGGHER